MNIYLGCRRFLSYHFFQGVLGGESGMLTLYEPTVATEKATFAMGCFWQPDVLFGSSPGVIRTRVGYTGGAKENPTYHSLGDHTETTVIDYDPLVTNYEAMLALFWGNHNPTVQNSTQYMSAIYYHDDEQKSLAEKTMAAAQKELPKPIVTKIIKAPVFYNAEMYHQKYNLQNHPSLCKSLGITDFVSSHVAARLNGYLGGQGGLAVFEAEWPKLGITKEQADYVRKELTNAK